MHVTAENEARYSEAVERMISFRYPTFRALARSRSLRVVGMNVQQSLGALRDRLRKRRLLLKDPLAVFSAEWLARRFEASVVILVRHPASFVSSIKRLNWGFDYERNWLAQPSLMRDLLPGYESEFRGYRGEVDLVGEGIVVWNAIYDVVAGYRERHPEWTIVRYEDLAGAPVPLFRRLYDDLGLTWSDAAERTIVSHSSGGRHDAEVESKHEIRRDSAAAARAWRDRLAPEEIDRIRRGTERVWRRFYDDPEWEAPSTPPG
jgi:hypothetical protein